MLKLIASDLDGTLLDAYGQSPDPEIFELILEFKKKGVRFVAASGRQFQNMQRLFSPVKDDIFYIAENGALTYDATGFTVGDCICHNTAIEIMDEIQKSGHGDIALSCKHTVYLDRTRTDFVNFLQNTVQYDTTLTDNLLLIQDPILKVALFAPDGSESYIDHYQKKFDSRVKVVTSGKVWIDFIAPTVDKAAALQVLCKKLGISRHECVAFGDQYNDLEMLKFAGTSYAMANCAPGIEKYADHQTDSVQKELRKLLSML